MKRALFPLALPMLLAACATASGGEGGSSSPPLESISFSAGACFGTCPMYRVDVKNDGSGVLHGERFTAQAGDQPIHLTPAQWDAAQHLLAPYRPADGTTRKIQPGEPGCELVATDMPAYDIVWNSGTSRAATLRFYAGCHDEANGPLREAIRKVPATLGIEPLLRPGR